MIRVGEHPTDRETPTCGHPLWESSLLCTLPAGHAGAGHVYKASDCPDRHTAEVQES